MGKINLTKTPIRAPFSYGHYIMCIQVGWGHVTLVLVMLGVNGKLYRKFVIFHEFSLNFRKKMWQPRGPKLPLPAGFIFDLQYIGDGSLYGNSHYAGSSCPWEIHIHQPGMYYQPYFSTPPKYPPVVTQGGPTIKTDIVPKLCFHRLITTGGTAS